MKLITQAPQTKLSQHDLKRHDKAIGTKTPLKIARGIMVLPQGGPPPQNASYKARTVLQRRDRPSYMPTTLCGVYSLNDPRTHRRMYVGQSCDLIERLKQWVFMFERLKAPTKVLNDWFNDLGRDNLEFEFEILCECKPEHLNFMERFWAEKLNETHKLLQNISLCGNVTNRSLHITDKDPLLKMKTSGRM